jgi:hypothetical protein
LHANKRLGDSANDKSLTFGDALPVGKAGESTGEEGKNISPIRGNRRPSFPQFLRKSKKQIQLAANPQKWRCLGVYGAWQSNNPLFFNSLRTPRR